MWILWIWGRGPYRVDLSFQVSRTARQLVWSGVQEWTYSWEDILCKSASSLTVLDELTLNFLLLRLKA